MLGGMADEIPPDEQGEQVQDATGRVWKLGEVRVGQALMDWQPEPENDDSDDQ